MEDQKQINQLNVQNNKLSQRLANMESNYEGLKTELDKANEENKSKEVMIEELKEQQDQNIKYLSSTFDSDSKLEIKKNEQEDKDKIQTLSLVKLASIKRV